MTFLIWKREMTLFKKNAMGTIIPGIMLPLIMLFAIGKLLGGIVPFKSSVDYLTYVSSAIVVITIMTTSTFVTGFDHLSDFQFTKNVEELLTSPANILQIVLGKALGITSKSLSGSLVIYAIATLCGAKIINFKPSYLLGFSVLILAGILYSLFTIICALVAPNHDSFVGILNLFVMPQLFFSETFFNIEILGEYKWVLNISPLYHLVRAFRDSILFSIDKWTFISIGVVVIVILLFLSVAKKLIKKRLIN
ncbi:ABC-2 family transporter [Ruminiclostridium sufflavum DSM 19573]|uniref:Transport permease protein n=1 Tax=Ruminiclostridium sufflavum DSM 19573 TaxID=1121337 RepID=A0A318XL89_9FIRM|nr:ABC transporter permease [Ruminiclostridium sufflavum]PYG88014.1 ABC-2 family transporter [Ruminiclostridium sufflavum DSM 19573]